MMATSGGEVRISLRTARESAGQEIVRNSADERFRARQSNSQFMGVAPLMTTEINLRGAFGREPTVYALKQRALITIRLTSRYRNVKTFPMLFYDATIH